MEPGVLQWACLAVSGEIAGNLPHRVAVDQDPQPIMWQRDHPPCLQKALLELRLFGRNVSAMYAPRIALLRERVGVAPRHASTFRVCLCQDLSFGVHAWVLDCHGDVHQQSWA